jgi:hypothetical protein
MGQIHSTNDIDLIAANYILSMDYKNLQRLHDKNYCDKLTRLTSTVIRRHFTDLEISKMSKGVNCNEVAKFYIKIAHIYAAIICTINPEYYYKDKHGKKIVKGLHEKASIPKDAAIHISKINLCSEKIDALKGSEPFVIDGYEEEEEGEKLITVQPNICSLDSSKEDEGINELMDLYFDSDYDPKLGRFLGMSEETKKIYLGDLKRFYSIFTGTESEEMPPSIKKFSDIKMRHYGSKPYCVGSHKSYTGTNKDSLFVEYAANLRQMIQKVNKKQKILMKIAKHLFSFEKSGSIRINPNLKNDQLQDIINETRHLILGLYLECESDFSIGVKIYEAIVEHQMFETTQKQIKQLELEKAKLLEPFLSK